LKNVHDVPTAVLSAYGFIAEFPLGRYHRAPLMMIDEGTNEIQP
jgi:alkylation response protein AidB-like acyl-CoA dehydrogenase